MKRLLISTTALAVAMSGLAPASLVAQETAVECVEGQPCPDDEAAKKAARKAAKEAEKAARKAAKEAEAAAQAEAEAAARAEAEAAQTAADAAAQAEAEAAAKAAADAAAQAEAEAAAQAEAEAAKAAADAAAQAEADTAAAEAAQAEAEAAAKAAAEAAAQAEAEAAQAAADAAAQAEADAAAQAAAEAATQGEADAGQAEAEAADATEPPPEAAAALEGLLTTTDSAAPVAAAALTPGNSEDGSGAQGGAVSATETVLTEDDTRSSDEDFAPAKDKKSKKDKKEKKDKKKSADEDEGLSDFEKFGLVALGALAVGAILANGDRVVENTGDRVVVARSDGTYQVLKDDDTLVRQPGSTVKTETFVDGSTRTVVTRADGSQVVTIRDAAGRVLRRSSYDASGRETVLIDDLAPVRPIDVTKLPRAPEVTLSAGQDPAALEAALAAVRAREAATGSFALSQVRDIREVRALAPRIEVSPITFATGSAAIDPSEATKLAELGGLVARMVRARPNEVFLIEGHTDAVGSAASNLALSDRRAESVALALTEYFDVPPENLVVQGYGESDLLVPTDAAEPRNRRVAVRVITPLLTAAR